MATDDYGQGITVADLTMAADAEFLAKNIANGLASRSILRFASASARTAALVGVAAPVEGMVTWLQDVNRLYVYDGSAHVELDKRHDPVFAPDPANLSFTGGTYSNGTRPLSAVITMPPSGRVLATWGVRCDNSVSANTLSCILAVGVTTGIVYSPNDEAAAQWADNVSAGPFVGMAEFNGPAGEQFTVTVQHRIAGGGGTSNLRNRYLRLDPI